MDIYQERYLAHQKRKAKVLAQIIKERHSERQFGEGEINLKSIENVIDKAPSSCSRKAIHYEVIMERYEKNLLSGLLVGGTGWIHRADKIILLFADPVAYKGKGEIAFMPFIDAGVLVGQIYLQATADKLAVCFCNPHTEYKELFDKIFNCKNLIFCGAIALGKKKGG